MRLVIFQDYLRVGGTERQSLALAAAAQELGHTVTLLTCRPGGPLAAAAQELEWIVLQPFDSGIDEWAPGLDKKLLALKPDVVMCMGQVANRYVAQLKKIAPKVVATARSGKRISKKILAAYAQADLVITNTFSLQAALYALGLKVPVGVVANGLLVHPHADKVSRMLLRRKMGADDNTPVALCLQRMVPGKAQHYLMEAFVCASMGLKSQLWVVGKGPMDPVLRAYAQVLGPDRIKVITPNMPLAHYYNAADFAVTASHEDALPNFLIEAQAFGLAGLCENYAGCGEVVLNGMTGFVSPLDDDAYFVAAFQQLLINPALRDILGENARRLAFRFDPKRQAHQLLSLVAAL